MVARLDKHKHPPKIEYTIQSYDTAFLKKETADYSAITTWGIFKREGSGHNMILLSAFKDRYEFPELRRVAQEEYKYWQTRHGYNRGQGIGDPTYP